MATSEDKPYIWELGQCTSTIQCNEIERVGPGTNTKPKSKGEAMVVALILLHSWTLMSD